MPPAPAPALPVTFRPVRTRVILVSTGVVMLVVLTVVALLLEQLSAGERASFVATGALFLAVLVLLARPHVRADTAGITVVNLTRTRRLDWAEIVAVNLRAGDPWVYLDLTDGTSLPAMGIQPGLAREQAVRDAAALRALAEERGTRHGGTAGDGGPR
ncbi:PH domain-containing protein [Streptomyces sp. TRM 70351]|uniref:PH domain-containing protein n=1 Tax=Streptomyces sp. TRM 70351 TaxID=3116552 RepID=UPI002E7B86C9|nr:PH domain-containing protein [Streptomyces sp. TRM 70351]MEE1928998.1 PH domain-containing protein [Streptomyces sp. TRM 70351]